jgi:O-antigen biosynthesis protein WbqP
LVVGLSALVVLVLPIMMVSILVKFTTNGSVLYWSERIGKVNKIFRMPKFRTMRSDTPQLATHLMNEPDEYLSPIGGCLRRTRPHKTHITF